MIQLNEQPPPVEFPNTWPHEYLLDSNDEQLLGDPIFSECESRCERGWLPAPDSYAYPCNCCLPQ